MEVAFILAGEITQVKESISWVRFASGNVLMNNHNLNTVVATTMHNIQPSNNVEDFTAINM